MLSMRGEKWVWEAKIGWKGNDYEIGPITECNIIDGGSTSGTFIYDERQCKKKKWCFSFKYLIGIKRRNIYQSDWFLGERVYDGSTFNIVNIYNNCTFYTVTVYHKWTFWRLLRIYVLQL